MKWFLILFSALMMVVFGQAMNTAVGAGLDPLEDPNLAMPDRRSPNHTVGAGLFELLDVVDSLNNNQRLEQEWDVDSELDEAAQ